MLQPMKAVLRRSGGKTAIRWLIARALPLYYRLKVFLYGWIAGPDAASAVVTGCLRPDVVLRLYGARIGKNVRINRGLILHETGNDFSNLTIGDDVHIGRGVLIDLSGRVTIGDRAGIGMFTRLLTHQNLGDSTLSRDYPASRGDVVIGEDVVTGCGAILLYPTRLAPRTLVSAGSVVRGSYDTPCVLVGNPARPTFPTPPAPKAQ